MQKVLWKYILLDFFHSEIWDNFLPANWNLHLSLFKKHFMNLFASCHAHHIHFTEFFVIEDRLLEQLVKSKSTDEINTSCAENSQHNAGHINKVECFKKSGCPASAHQFIQLLVRTSLVDATLVEPVAELACTDILIEFGSWILENEVVCVSEDLR